MWNDLTMKQKSDLMSIFIRNGINNLDTIRDTYNKYAEGGDIEFKPIDIKDYHYDNEGNIVNNKTGEVGTLATPEVEVTTPRPIYAPKPWSYKSSFDGSLSNTIETLNAMTAGGLNRLSPTQNLRALYDIGQGIIGNKTASEVANSIYYGNNGLFSDDFAREYPYLSVGINSAADAMTGVALVKPPLSSSFRPSVGGTGKAFKFNTEKALDYADLMGRTAIGASTGAVAGTYIADKVAPEYGYIATLIPAAIGGSYNATWKRPLINKLYSINKPLGRTTNDFLNRPITTSYYIGKGSYHLNRGKTYRDYIKAGREGIGETLNDLQEAYPNSFIHTGQPSIEPVKYEKDYLKRYPGTGGVFNNGRIIVPLFRKEKSNLPIITRNKFKAITGHEGTHSSIYRRDLGTPFPELTEYDENRGYYITNPDIKNISGLDNTIEDVFNNKVRTTSSWHHSPEEMFAEFNYFKRKKGLKGKFSDMSPKNQKSFIKFASDRFFLDPKEAKRGIIGIEDYFDALDKANLNYVSVDYE